MAESKAEPNRTSPGTSFLTQLGLGTALRMYDAGIWVGSALSGATAVFAGASGIMDMTPSFHPYTAKPVLLLEAAAVTLVAGTAAYQIGKLGYFHNAIDDRIKQGEIGSFKQLRDELKADYLARHTRPATQSPSA